MPENWKKKNQLKVDKKHETQWHKSDTVTTHKAEAKTDNTNKTKERTEKVAEATALADTAA